MGRRRVGQTGYTAEEDYNAEASQDRQVCRLEKAIISKLKVTRNYSGGQTTQEHI